MNHHSVKVTRKFDGYIRSDYPNFRIGDQLQVGHYTATCQNVGKNGTIFMFDQYLDETRVMNLRVSNDGYEASDLRNFLKELAMNSMFDEIREMMVPFKKTGDLLRIPTAEEMFGPEEAHKYYETLSSKKQWSLMKDRRNRIAFCGEDQEIECGWLQNRYKNSSSWFSDVTGHGYASRDNAANIRGVRVVFKLLV